MKRIYLDEHSTGYKKRLYQKLLKRGILRGAYQDTWCQLFRTKGYKKAKTVVEKLENQINYTIYKQFGGVIYNIELIGDTKLIAVSSGRNQRYLLVLHDD